MVVELLAPAGSFESMKAAYTAGADAVYIGGNRFGARAFADNLDTEQMKKAIDYAHIRNKQLYLTVNTLLKDQELEDLYSYILPFYEEGLDAVIVQDLGVLSYIHEMFPDMNIHASTQMTITGTYGARFLKELGASRIVTARELSLAEIHQIHEQVDIEIESFVHGALCFCYSGQCLLSSMIGGRSGNRGRCAQPCRLPYQLFENEKMISKAEEPYLMSPKDMCALDLIPECITAGIYSFKMEGRMKKPEYTAGITQIYRKYIDLYLEKGQEGFTVTEQDKNILMDLYNRGGFSQGYYKKHNQREMMSMSRPNHWGTIAARYSLKGKKKGWIAAEDLNKNDVLEYRKGNQIKEFTFHESRKKGERLSVDAYLNNAEENSCIYRTRNEKLLSDLKHLYIDQDSKLKINGKLILLSGKSAILKLSFGKYQVHAEGEIVQTAQKRPVTIENVEKQIKKLGQSDFVFEHLDIILDDNIFYPLQGLNELRRDAVLALEKKILQNKRRTSSNIEISDMIEEEYIEKCRPKHRDQFCFTVSVESEEQFLEVLNYNEVDRIYIDSSMITDYLKFFGLSGIYIKKCHEQHKECYFILPWVFRAEKNNVFLDNPELIQALELFDGVVVKNLEEYEYLSEAGYPKKIVTDYNVYTWNRQSEQFWNKRNIELCTLPFELNYRELLYRGCHKNEIVVYGHMPLMVSAQCFQKNTIGCTKTSKVLKLQDRMKKIFYIKNNCTFCYNVLYNSAPLELAENLEQIKTLGISSVRVSLTIEDLSMTKIIMKQYIDVFRYYQNQHVLFKDFTRGHFKRKVE